MNLHLFPYTNKRDKKYTNLQKYIFIVLIKSYFYSLMYFFNFNKAFAAASNVSSVLQNANRA